MPPVDEAHERVAIDKHEKVMKRILVSRVCESTKAGRVNIHQIVSFEIQPILISIEESIYLSKRQDWSFGDNKVV